MMVWVDAYLLRPVISSGRPETGGNKRISRVYAVFPCGEGGNIGLNPVLQVFCRSIQQFHCGIFYKNRSF